MSLSLILYPWILAFAHMVADWGFQTEWEATNKTRDTTALLKHCAIYTAIIGMAFIYLDISLIWLVLVFSSHVYIDRRTPIIWWIEKVKRTRVTKDTPDWLVVVIDQMAHAAVLMVIMIIDLTQKLS